MSVTSRAAALGPARDGGRSAEAELVLEANARATQALVSAAVAVGFGACAVSILSSLAIDALIASGLASWLARLIAAALLGLPALALARRAAAQIRRRHALPLEALGRLLAEATRPAAAPADDAPGG